MECLAKSLHLQVQWQEWLVDSDHQKPLFFLKTFIEGPAVRFSRVAHPDSIERTSREAILKCWVLSKTLFPSKAIERALHQP